jgi:hypothetical protein
MSEYTEIFQIWKKKAKICQNMPKYAIFLKTQKYAKKKSRIKLGFWGHKDLIRIEPEFQKARPFQLEYANMSNPVPSRVVSLMCMQYIV